MYRHILIATDGSELAQKAVVHGLQLAKSVGAKVSIVTATEMWSPVEMAEKVRQHQTDPVGSFERAAAERAAAVLEKAATDAKKLGVAIEKVHVADKTPERAILETQADKGCDLIVIATHGRGAIGRALLGSIALRVLTQAPVPVTILR